MTHDSNQCSQCISGLTECPFDPRQRAAEAEQRAFEAWDGGYPAAECFDMGPQEPVLEVVPEGRPCLHCGHNTSAGTAPICRNPACWIGYGLIVPTAPETVDGYTSRTVDGISIRADGTANPTAAQLGLNAYTERALRGVDALVWAAEVPL